MGSLYATNPNDGKGFGWEVCPDEHCPHGANPPYRVHRFYVFPPGANKVLAWETVRREAGIK